MKKVIVLVVSALMATACGVSTQSSSSVQSAASVRDVFAKDIDTVVAAKEDLEGKYPLGTVKGLNGCGVGGTSNSNTWISLNFETALAKAKFEKLMTQNPELFSKKNNNLLYAYRTPGSHRTSTIFVRVKLEVIGPIVIQ